MEFLKKHYEKIILSVVLLGLAAVAAWLPMKVSQEKQKEEQRKMDLIGAKVQPFKDIDLSTNEAVLVKVKTPIKFDIAGKHNLFNPVPWVKYPNGDLIKVKTGDEIGLGALQVVAIRPLNLIVTYDGVVGAADDPKYQITVIRETKGGGKNQRAFSAKGANNMGTLKDVKGPADNPTEIVFQPVGEKESIVLTKDKPYTKEIGWAADLQYAPANTQPSVIKDVRKGDPVRIGTEQYKIVAIEKEVVVFSAVPSQKQTVKKLASLQ